jgi:hypothetical protein
LNTIIEEADNCIGFVHQRSSIMYFLITQKSYCGKRLQPEVGFMGIFLKKKNFGTGRVEEDRKVPFEWQVW